MEFFGTRLANYQINYRGICNGLCTSSGKCTKTIDVRFVIYFENDTEISILIS